MCINYTVYVQLMYVITEYKYRRSFMQTVRIDIRIPHELLKDVEKYQNEQMITTRTQSLLELVRLGLKSNKRSDK